MAKIPQSSNKSIHDALRVLALDIQSEDGVANAAVAEAADRLAELERENAALRAALTRADLALDNLEIGKAAPVRVIARNALRKGAQP